MELQFQCRVCGIRTPPIIVLALPERGEDFRPLVEQVRAWGWRITTTTTTGGTRGRNLLCSSCAIAPQDREWAVLDSLPLLSEVA